MGLLLTKMAIFHIMKDFEVHQTDETPVPVVFNTRSLIPQPSEKLLMKFTKAEPLF